MERPFPGHLSFGDLVDRVAVVTQELLPIPGNLGREAAGVLAGRPLQREWIRVPLDLPRRNVRSLPWQPFVLSQLKVSANEDLVGLMHELRQFQRHTLHSLPLLSDENIHYRLSKLLYGQTTSEHTSGVLGTQFCRVRAYSECRCRTLFHPERV